MSGSKHTIFAVASGSGGAIAILRLSGERCETILEALCRGSRPLPREAAVRDLWHRDERLDRVLLLWFPGPKSYTGEDVLELHLHAGPAVLVAVAEALVAHGARPAEPGEFSRRAFLNGRMDLLQAEGVADLIEAETQAQRRQALNQSQGALSALYDGWAGRLRSVLAHQEALIDFPDETLTEDAEAGLLDDVRRLSSEIAGHLDTGASGERLRRGLLFAVIGPPNVGKSSLVNRLCEREIAIVSEQSGTTRDALEARVVLGEVPVTLVDTAGLRETTDAIEAEGIRRAKLRAAEADLVIRVIDPSIGQDPGPRHDLLVCNKIDLAPAPADAIGISARTGDGMAALRDALVGQARRLTDAAGAPPLTRSRHRAALQESAEHLHRALTCELPELRGEELRLAMRALGRLTGVVGVEDLLDTVFGQFCIGK